MRTMIGRLHKDEFGAELIEFIGMLPILLMAGMIAFQIILVAQTILVASSAAREGARALSVCGPCRQAALNASPGDYDQQIDCQDGTESVRVTVRLRIPLVTKAFFTLNNMPRVEWTTVMRKEHCKK